MIKLNEPERKTIQMCRMLPLEIARIVDRDSYSFGDIVMRTASGDKFEVMNMSKPGVNNCWSENAMIRVELIEPGKVFTLELFNK